MKITLRQRPLKNQSKASIFLDYAPPIPHPTKAGKLMRFQFLNEWVYAKPKTPFEKQHNSDTLARCQKKKNKIENELLKDDIYNPFEIERLKIQENENINFIDLMNDIKKLKTGTSSIETFNAAIAYLKDFNGSDVLKLKDLNTKYIENYRSYLQQADSLRNKNKKLNPTTAAHYLNSFKSTLLYAFTNSYISNPLHKKVIPIEPTINLRVFLNSEEIQLLINTRDHNDLLYRVTFFILLTGLRISDVKRLKWSDLVSERDGCYIKIRIKKNNEPIKHTINQQALKLMGTIKKDNSLVFDGLNVGIHRAELAKWCNDVGIEKYITWHKLRHTFSVGMLKETKNIYLLQQLLHQRDIKSTQAYAHIIDKDKKKAMDDFIIDNL